LGRASRIIRAYPGFACGEAVHGDEGAVELAELVGRGVTEEGDPHDRVCGWEKGLRQWVSV
jgi:hypothetical protein